MIRQFCVPLVVCFLSLTVIVPGAVHAKAVTLVVNSELPAAARHGLDYFAHALSDKGLSVTTAKAIPKAADSMYLIGVAGKSAAVDRLLADHKLSLGRKPESLLVKRIPGSSAPATLIAGRDARGLMYALMEAARAVQLSLPESDPLAAVVDTAESPELAVRSVSIHLFNHDLDSEWFYSEDFWRKHFAMLALCRFNTFALTYADHTAYMNPPYPFFVTVPEYPQVKAIGLSKKEQERNLKMLKRISELADEHGIDFVFSTWMQGLRILGNLGDSTVDGLPERFEQHRDYCAKALGRLLKACPKIRGVQFRMNLESGIPESKQAEFYTALFEAIRDCGHPVSLDLRFKGLRYETINAALTAGVPVNVSTKFWCEQMGLPYHPSIADKHYRGGRYSYADMLHYPRYYDVTYRLWTVGTQKILLWGNPDYGSRFAKSCQLGGGRGFEVFAPLSNKGYGNAPGTWRIFVDRSYEHYRWEFDRYWMFYLTFGRTGYRSDVPAEVWRREFRHRFGPAAEHVEAAYRTSGQILTLITAARNHSASEWRTWPEMEPGYILPAYARAVPQDLNQFYSVRAHRRVAGWRGEGWRGDIPGYVDDATAGKLQAKWTPQQIAGRLHELSRKTLDAVEKAHANVPDPQSAEFKGTELDMRILANIADYHAEKTLAATQVELFDITKENGRLPIALEHAKNALAAWERIVELTDGVYYAKMNFGMFYPHTMKPPFENTKKEAHHLRGHWKDRLPMVRYDVAYVEKLLEKHGGQGKPYKQLPGEEPLSDPPVIEHKPITSAKPSEPLVITTRITSRRPLERVLLHHRPLNQKLDWQTIEMRGGEKNLYTATIPGKNFSPSWDYMYYIEARVAGGGMLWPSWEKGWPYVVVRVERSTVPPDTRPRRVLTTVAANGHTSVEAEDGFRTSKDYHNWCKRDKIAGYSGNGYYVVEPDSGTRVHIRPMEMSPGIEIPLKFEHAGKYRLWLRMSGPDTSGNSVYVGLDRQEVQSGKRMTVKPGGWRWLGDYEQGSPVMIEITEPGDHTLHLWMREDGVAIDRILLTTDPDFVPRNP